MSLRNSKNATKMPQYSLHSAAASATLQSLLTQSPNGMQRPDMELPSCCCSKIHCAYLKRNNSALEGLEKDLRNAAQIGQVCLTRST